MPIPITIPSLGESISEVTLGAWHKQDGDWVEKDDVLVELESDKATQELRAPALGTLRVKAKTGVELPIGAVVAEIDDSAKRPDGATSKAGARSAPHAAAEPSAATAAEPKVAAGESVRATSVAKKIAAEKGVDIAAVSGTGPSGRVTKDDVLAASAPSGAASTAGGSGAAAATRDAPTPAPALPSVAGARTTRRERMTRLRQTIAQRLVEAQHAAAMLTTFNEADMTEVMRLREQHKAEFEKAHGVGLGFMAFFVAASVSALRRFPRVNAFIVGDAKSGMEVQFHDFVDVAVAVGTDKGLVVPVVRNAETLSFAGVERTIKDLATRARDGKLAVDEMTGGTFTISNGGVYGSLLSTPILNPPQSAILGMHAIKRRPVEDPTNPGQVALRPMMNLALSYDHRIIDGAEAVGFLVHVKNCIERPERLLLGV